MSDAFPTLDDDQLSVVAEVGEHIHIVIQEIEDGDRGYCGMLTSDWRKLRNTIVASRQTRHFIVR